MVSAAAVALAVYQGVDLTYIHSHFLQLATATFLISVLLSIYLYVRSRYAPAEQLALGGNSGENKDHRVTDTQIAFILALSLFMMDSLRSVLNLHFI